jgi:hypothetical protein
MPRSRLVTAALLFGVALASAAVVMLVAWERGGGDESAPGLSPEPTATEPGAPPQQAGPQIAFEDIGARAVLSPRTVLFGDLVNARVEVIIENTVVDPDSVRVAISFAPWAIVGQPERTQRDAGTKTYLRTSWVLRCLISPCVPSGQVAPLEFDAARVSYVKDGKRTSAPVQWPLLTVYSRFASANFEGGSQAGPATPWRADLLTMPEVSYRVSPWVVVGLALALGAAFAAGGIALAVVAWPRRTPAPPPEPEPEPLPQLTPLEQALELLEDASREDGVEDRRRSLELVAEVLEAHEGAGDIVRRAKVLAWSEEAPAVHDTSGLAASVRSRLLEEAAQQRNGDADVD